MKIDCLTGALEFDGTGLVNPRSREEFLTSRVGQESRLIFTNKQWMSYSILAKDGLDQFVVTLVFAGSELAELRFAKAAPGATWANWSKEEELQRKAEHDCLLERLLGRPPYYFPWGDVSSVFDSKSGGSEVIIRYKCTLKE